MQEIKVSPIHLILRPLISRNRKCGRALWGERWLYEDQVNLTDLHHFAAEWTVDCTSLVIIEERLSCRNCFMALKTLPQLIHRIWQCVTYPQKKGAATFVVRSR